MSARNIPQPNLPDKLYVHEVNYCSYPGPSLNPAVAWVQTSHQRCLFFFSPPQLTGSFLMINANYNDSTPISCAQM